MSLASEFNLSPSDGVLAALSLLAAVDKSLRTHLPAYLAQTPSLAAARAGFIIPLIVDMADAPDGVETVLEVLESCVPPHLGETAYILCADYIAGFSDSDPALLRLLERLATCFSLDRLTRAALDRAALARSRNLDPLLDGVSDEHA